MLISRLSLGAAALATITVGALHNLNVIGVPKDKTADMTGNNGRRIFVPGRF